LNKAKISKFWKNHFGTPYIAYTLPLFQMGYIKHTFAALVSTKLHSFCRLNSIHSNDAMWQSSSFKFVQPFVAMCHYPIKWCHVIIFNPSFFSLKP